MSPLLPLETYEPSELSEQLSCSALTERQNSKSQMAADSIPSGSLLPFLDTLSSVPPQGACVPINTPSPFQSSGSTPSNTDSSVQVKREPVSPKGTEQNVNSVLQSSPCAPQTEEVEQNDGICSFLCFKIISFKKIRKLFFPQKNINCVSTAVCQAGGELSLTCEGLPSFALKIEQT